MNVKSIFVNKNSKLRSGYKIILVAAACAILIAISSLMVNGVISLICGGNQALLKEASANEGVGFFNQCMPEIIFMLVPILAWKLIEKGTLKDIGFVGGKEGIRNLIAGLIFGAASISIVFFSLLFTKNISLTGSLLSPSFTTAALWDLAFYTLVGLGEEILFRGYCMGIVNRYNKKWVGVLVSAVLFSAAHGANPNVKPLFFINVVLIGFFFSYMYCKSSCLWLPIGYHIMWDYFEGNVWGLADSGSVVQGIYKTNVVGNSIINGGLTGPEGGLAVTLIILLGFLIVKIHYSKARNNSEMSMKAED